MKILVTGSKGQLGYDCVRELRERGYNDVMATDIDDLDITNEAGALNYVSKNKPDVIIHCASWTAVDKAEENKESVYKINVLGTKNLVQAARTVGAKILYISTDYVFHGDGCSYQEINDFKRPLSVYGKSKLDGEKEIEMYSKHFILRISWLFGVNGSNFVKTMLKLGKAHKKIDVVCDQIGSPTYAVDLAKLICDMIETERYGTYHATNEGICSWADFAEAIFRYSHLNVKVNRVTTKQYLFEKPHQALRPLNSRLSKKSLDDAGFRRLPSWEDALIRYLREIC